MSNPMKSDRNMLVMKASAGSGKTYNLALQYIQHLLFDTDEDGHLVPRRHGSGILNAHRQLLAITFTNAATDEMKDRIVKELYVLSQPGMNSDYLEGFMLQSRLDESAVRLLARQALNELLFDYSNFNVSTIDSFFQSILRNFARELDRDFNYDIQLDEDYAVRVAVHNFLMALGRQGMPSQVNEWVKTYQQHLIYGDNKKRKWKFFDDGGDLFKFAKKLNSEIFRSRMDEIRDYLGRVDENGVFHSDYTRIGAFMGFLHKSVERCNEEATRILESLKQNLEPLYDSLSGSKTFKKWLNKGGADPLSDTVNGADWDVIKGQFLSGMVPEDTVVDRLLELVTSYFKYALTMDFLKHIETNLGMLGMLAMIDWFLQEYRHESNSILIGDTNELIGTVLDSGSAFVYERVGSTIAHFMIDEFQDTSTKQYENFRGLLKESLASGHFNMLIGDAKQSIYRFRNADPTVFREKVDVDFKDEIYQPNVEPGKPTSTNYRSSRHIIEFNNALFEAVKDVYSDTSVVVSTYADVMQGIPNKIDDKKLPGYVKLILGGYQHLADVSQPTSTEKGDEVDVLDVLPDYLIALHERYDWGQIGILVNTNKEGNRIVESILERNKHLPDDQRIEIISGESLLLNNSPIIRRVIAMLRFIDISQFSPGEESEDDRDDTDTIENGSTLYMRKRESDQRLYAALGSFIKEISARDDCSPVEVGEMLEKCLQAVGDDSHDGDSQHNGEDDYSKLLSTMLPPANELTTLVSIVETIISTFKKNASRDSDIDNEVAFLLAFQDAVMDFSSQRNGGSVREFLKYWDEQKGRLAVKSSSTSNAVNIMTIHGAKGLEFDCVLIPFATWDLTNNSKEHDYWMPREAFVDALQSLPVDEKEWNLEMVPPLLNVNKKAATGLNKNKLLTGKAAEFVDKQYADLLIDNLNKTYVAFTRPCTEMHIMSKPPVKGKRKSGSMENEPPKNMSELLSRLAPVVMTPVPNPDGGTPVWYEYGVLSTREEMNALREKIEKQSGEQQEPHPVFIRRYTVSEIPRSIGVRVERASSRYIDAGIRLHSVLSDIHDRDDVEHAIALGLKHGIITSDPEDSCGLDNVLAHVSQPILDESSRVSVWFDPANKVYSERTITTASSSLWDEDGIENLRPDRIVRRPDGTMLVIDYKSGERRDKLYCRQVQNYISKLQAIFPDTKIAGRIWYVTHDIILDHNGKELT